MDITNHNKQNITFQSKIKFVNQTDFNDMIKKLSPKRHEVMYPWQPNDIKKGKNLYTKGIMDCIAGGVVDGKDVTMFHLGVYRQAQAKKYHQKGFNIKEIERRLLEKINLSNDKLHAFILGGFQLKENSKYNINMLKKVAGIFKKHNIPYTMTGGRRDVHYFGKFSMLYKNKEDTFYITNNTSENAYKEGMWKELCATGDKLKYHTYKHEPDPKIGIKTYTRSEHEGSLKDYLNSQFRHVSICRFDEFV